MYVAGRDHPNREPSRRLLERVRNGDVEACSSTEVLQEILYRYSALGRLDLAAKVYELFVRICPVIHPVVLADTDRAKSILCEASEPTISARDAVHAAVMLNHGITTVASFDRGFDHVTAIERLQPS
jgi:predicted nucleic acid-binding protein